jgi:hypothetical protein
MGKTLGQGSLPKIIQNQVTIGALPEDTAGIYIVFTAADVIEAVDSAYQMSFCTDYCGYTNITKISFVNDTQLWQENLLRSRW